MSQFSIISVLLIPRVLIEPVVRNCCIGDVFRQDKIYVNMQCSMIVCVTLIISRTIITARDSSRLTIVDDEDVAKSEKSGPNRLIFSLLLWHHS